MSTRFFSPNAVRCRWRVTGGILPGMPEHEYTKFYELSVDEYDGGKGGLTRFLELEALAGAYARYLQIQCTVGRGPNWTEIDFLWY